MSLASIQINTRQVGIERTSFGTGWRTFRRQVTILGEDRNYSDVEVGQVSVNRQTVRVYRRRDIADAIKQGGRATMRAWCAMRRRAKYE